MSLSRDNRDSEQFQGGLIFLDVLKDSVVVASKVFILDSNTLRFSQDAI